MTEPGQVHAEPHAGRFRFSLRALFLFVLVSGLAFSHLVASWRLRLVEGKLADAKKELDEATSEVNEVRGMLGELNTGHADQLCAVASPFFRKKNLRWRWQVLSPDSSYRLCAAVKDIPQEGVPTTGAQVLVPHLPKGECSIEVTVRRNLSGEWKLHAECVSVDSQFRMVDPIANSIDISKSLADSLQSEFPPIARTKAAWARQGHPLDLLRPPFIHGTRNAESRAQKVGDGIILWIEKDRPVPDSALPLTPP
jgi:hypothetical protein